MPSPRREKIEAMLADEPHDAFLRYSLAMELAKEEQHEASLALLAQLQQEPTPLPAAFFMSGRQLAALGRVSDAREVLRRGIDEARRQSNPHAAGEMSEFLAELGSLGE